MMREQLPQGLENLIQSIGDMPIPENGEADISIKIRGNDVMERPMFAAGGGANKFPDLSGDGQVTQKDILMGRGVIQNKPVVLFQTCRCKRPLNLRPSR